MVRHNFEKRGSAKMTQLMQDVRKNLNEKPTWMEDDVWAQLKAHWESSSFKNKSEINKRNRKSMDGASLHTGGSIPHRLHWKRMKEEKGTDPSLAEFYFRTHRRKKDQSWLGPHAESAYVSFILMNAFETYFMFILIIISTNILQILAYVNVVICRCCLEIKCLPE
ncbi:hypothetical protein GmHk_16G046384 [Glycine max]|nr:hypothetical protein GmHk_16G046384 [Glycine max]